MRASSIRQVALAVTIGLLTMVGAHASPQRSRGIAWMTDFSKAKALAAKQKKLMMVDFFTDWCGWCKKLDRDTWPDARVVEFAKNVVPVKLNAESTVENMLITRKYGVQSFPAIGFIDGNGRLVMGIPGYLPPEEMVGAMKAALVRATTKRR